MSKLPCHHNVDLDAVVVTVLDAVVVTVRGGDVARVHCHRKRCCWRARRRADHGVDAAGECALGSVHPDRVQPLRVVHGVVVVLRLAAPNDVRFLFF